jgi:hypothetical protein
MNREVKGNIPLLTGSRGFSLGFQPLQVAAIVPCSAAVDDGGAANRAAAALESYTLHGAAGNNARRLLKLDKR